MEQRKRGRSPRWLIALLTLVLTLLAHPTMAQVTPFDGVSKAPIVVDGRIVFEVRDTGNSSAAERAQQINAELEREVRSPRLAEIFVDQKDNLVYLQSRHTDEILATITDADVVLTQRQPFDQAQIWADDLQAALRQGQLERQPRYLRRAALYSIMVVVGAIAIHLLIMVVGRFVIRRFSRWLESTAHPLGDWERSLRLFWQLGLLGIQLGLWATVAYYVTDIFPQTRSWRYKLADFLNARVIDLGNRNYSALELLMLLVFTVALWFLVSVITRLFRLYVLNRAGVEQRVQDILSVLVQYSLTFLGVIILLQIWGIDVSSLAILASVLGVGLGFGVQNITNNFISGFIITLERPIQVGDFINVGELVGTVERIGARSTEIRTLDQVTIIVPNSRFLENEVINWSHGDPVSRLHIPVDVAYGSNIERVKTALLEAVRRHPEVLLRPKPEVWFQGYGESAIKFELLVWTGEPRKQFRVRSDLYYEIELSLRRHGITVPFPQRDLHLRSPQLDELIAIFKHQAGFSSPSPARPSDDTNEHPGDTQHDSLPLPPVDKGNGKPVPLSTEIPLSSLKLLENLDFDQLADAMRGDQGVVVSDRHYQFNNYPQCFTGTDAVEWFVQKRGYTREEAILIGQGLLQQGLIRSVTHDDRFRDGYYFYRFYQDEQALSHLEDPNTVPSGQVVTEETTEIDTIQHD